MGCFISKNKKTDCICIKKCDVSTQTLREISFEIPTIHDSRYSPAISYIAYRNSIENRNKVCRFCLQ